MTDEEILERLVALNAERAEEESRGIVRWLRPEFQTASLKGAQDGAAKQTSLALVAEEDEEADEGAESSKSRGKGAKKKAGAKSKAKPGAKAAPVAKAAKREWPKTREAQAKAVAGALRECDGPVAPDELAKRFTRAQRDVIEELLQAMVTLGLARRVRGGRYSG